MSEELRAAALGIFGTLLGVLFGAVLGALGTYAVSDLIAKRERHWQLEDDERHYFRSQREQIVQTIREFVTTATAFIYTVFAVGQPMGEGEEFALLADVQKGLEKLRAVATQVPPAISLLRDSDVATQLEEFSNHINPILELIQHGQASTITDQQINDLKDIEKKMWSALEKHILGPRVQ